MISPQEKFKPKMMDFFKSKLGYFGFSEFFQGAVGWRVMAGKVRTDIPASAILMARNLVCFVFFLH